MKTGYSNNAVSFLQTVENAMLQLYTVVLDLPRVKHPKRVHPFGVKTRAMSEKSITSLWDLNAYMRISALIDSDVFPY